MPQETERSWQIFSGSGEGTWRARRTKSGRGHTYHVTGPDNYDEIHTSVTTLVGRLISKPFFNAGKKQALNQVEVAFDQAVISHAERGEPYILQPHTIGSIINEAEAAMEEKSEASLAKGTRIHDLLSRFCDGEFADEEHQEDLVIAFQDWLDKNQFEVVDSERIVSSHRYEFAGTYDLLLRSSNHMAHNHPVYVIADIKTSLDKAPRAYPDHALQLAAYAQAYQEMTGNEVAECVVILIDLDDETGEVRIEDRAVDDLGATQRMFLSSLDLMRALGKPDGLFRGS
jgi:hypothetical protein